MTALGLLIRIWGLGKLGLVHFDEGIYAIAGLWPLRPGGLDPIAVPYAPPGFPFLIGLFYLVFGPSDAAAILVSIIAGTLAVPVSAWLARRTFGPGAGATASALAALSGFHVAFSRMALTDATFTLAWLLGLIAAQRFLEKPNPATAVLLGLATGLAQLVKYSGWTVGIAVMLTAAAITILDPSRRTTADQRRVWGWGLLAAVVAAIVYAPWYRFVETHGGYAGLMAHHRGYMGTPASWLPHWALQIEQASVLSGGFSWNLAAVVAAAVGIWIVGAGEPTNGESEGPRSGRMRGDRRRIEDSAPDALPNPVAPSSGPSGHLPPRGGKAVIPLLVLGAATVVAPTTLWWIGLALAAFAWRDASPGLRLLAVAWVGLSVLTPFYHPYARLWLPIQALGWIAVAGIVGELIRPAEAPRWRTPFVLACCVAAVVQTFLMGPLFGKVGDRAGLLAPSDSLRTSTSRALADLPEAAPGLRVLARPPVSFYIGGRAAARVEPDVEGLLRVPGGAWALVDAAQLRQSGDVDGLVARLSQGWERVGEYPTSLNLPTQLDVDPGAAARPRPREADAPLWLFRPRPGVR